MPILQGAFLEIPAGLAAAGLLLAALFGGGICQQRTTSALTGGDPA
jgi:hypothetical protein